MDAFITKLCLPPFHQAELQCEELNKRLTFLDESKSDKEDELKALKRKMDEIEVESEENRR